MSHFALSVRLRSLFYYDELHNLITIIDHKYQNIYVKKIERDNKTK